MLRLFLAACGRSLLHGPVIAAAASPLGITMVGIYLFLFLNFILLFLIPFFGLTLEFALSLLVWTFAARFAGTLAGLVPRVRPDFTAAFWAAFPAVLVIKIAAVVPETLFDYAVVELTAAGRTPDAFDLSLLRRMITDSVIVLKTVLIALIIVPLCCGEPARAMPDNTATLLMGRIAFAATVYWLVGLVAAYPILRVIELTREGWLHHPYTTDLVTFLTAPAFYLGMLEWLLAGIMLAFEANLLARAQRREIQADADPNWARELRAEWDRRDR